ncbi:MAG: hypothetical protein Q9217_001791 [Psora testacea]
MRTIVPKPSHFAMPPPVTPPTRVPSSLNFEQRPQLLPLVDKFQQDVMIYAHNESRKTQDLCQKMDNMTKQAIAFEEENRVLRQQKADDLAHRSNMKGKITELELRVSMLNEQLGQTHSIIRDGLSAKAEDERRRMEQSLGEAKSPDGFKLLDEDIMDTGSTEHLGKKRRRG